MVFTSLLLCCLALSAYTASPPAADSLPHHVLVGYWHNFNNAAGIVRLSAVPDQYDVVIVAFAEPELTTGAAMRFVPDPRIYPNPDDFIQDVTLLKNHGKKVLISVGGANSLVRLNTQTDADSFVVSMNRIVRTCGFDGVDIDLEAQSIALVESDVDFRAPKSPSVVNLINALKSLMAQAPAGFMLTLAPETVGVQGGYTHYGGAFGSYLPVIYALRDKITFVQVQHYNTGIMGAPDGKVYPPATADFHVALADMLLSGFPVGTAGYSITFPPLRPDQVVIGLPASPSAATSGYTNIATVNQALFYLGNGVPFNGQYLLSHPAGYPGIRGVMLWSINWDLVADALFSRALRETLNKLAPPAGIDGQSGGKSDLDLPNILQHDNYPNPFNGSTTIRFVLTRVTDLIVSVYDVLGEKVADLARGRFPLGSHEITFDAGNLPSGVYFYSLRSGGFTRTGKAVLTK